MIRFDFSLYISQKIKIRADDNVSKALIDSETEASSDPEFAIWAYEDIEIGCTELVFQFDHRPGFGAPSTVSVEKSKASTNFNALVEADATIESIEVGEWFDCSGEWHYVASCTDDGDSLDLRVEHEPDTDTLFTVFFCNHGIQQGSNGCLFTKLDLFASPKVSLV